MCWCFIHVTVTINLKRARGGKGLQPRSCRAPPKFGIPVGGFKFLHWGTRQVEERRPRSRRAPLAAQSATVHNESFTTISFFQKHIFPPKSRPGLTRSLEFGIGSTLCCGLKTCLRSVQTMLMRTMRRSFMQFLSRKKRREKIYGFYETFYARLQTPTSATNAAANSKVPQASLTASQGARQRETHIVKTKAR